MISYLKYLETEALAIIDQTYSNLPYERIAVLYSGGKDSCVVNHLTRRYLIDRFGKSYVQRHPPTLLSIDTGYGFPEVLEFFNTLVNPPVIRSVEDSIRRGTVPPRAYGESRNADQAVTLKEAVAEFGFQALLCGARRDEDRARAKERVFSHRDREGNWKPERQRMEIRGYYTDMRLDEGEHFRVFPISNWLERDVWEYIDKWKVEIPSIYYAHTREGYSGTVRFRTVGDVLTTKPVPSTAGTAAEVLTELLNARISERGATRLDDQALSMEERKRNGYF